MSQYWDLDDILSECELVECELAETAINLSWIDQSPIRSRSNIASSSSLPAAPPSLNAAQRSDSRSLSRVRSSSNASNASFSSNSVEQSTLRRQNSQQQVSSKKSREVVPTTTLPAGSWVEIPLWLAQIYATRLIMRLRSPPCMTASALDAMKADPGNVDLKARAPHFYRMGIKIASLSEPGSDLHRDLIFIMHKRYQEMVIKTTSIAATSSTLSLIQQASLSSHSFLSTPSLKIATKVDLTEREMLLARIRGLMGFARFVRREHTKIECPSQSLSQQRASRSSSSMHNSTSSSLTDKRSENERFSDRNSNVENESSNKRPRR